MQSVGGIAIGAPFEGDAIWELPVSCDVSGKSEFTVKPTTINSGLGVDGVRVRVVKHEIWLTVVTRPSGNASCPSVKLGGLSHGKYLVMYRGPDGRKQQVGEVTIGLPLVFQR